MRRRNQMLRHEVWIGGGKREKGAEHSMTKGNNLISNLIESYGKQENDTMINTNRLWSLNVNISIICRPTDARMEHVIKVEERFSFRDSHNAFCDNLNVKLES